MTSNASRDLAWLGLSESKISETVKNAALTQQLVTIVELAKESLKTAGMPLNSVSKQKVPSSFYLFRSVDYFYALTRKKAKMEAHIYNPQFKREKEW